MRHDRRACQTSKAASTVIHYIGVIALIGLLGVIVLIDRKAGEGAVAIVAGMTGVAIGSLGSMLNNTENIPAPSGTKEDPLSVKGTKGEAESLPVTDTTDIEP